jgi:hypothetical protein
MIITSYPEYCELIDRMNRDECVLTPIFSDPYYHVVENTVLCVGVTFHNLDTYVVSIQHTDAPTFDIPSGSKCLSENSAHILAYMNHRDIPKKEYDAYVNSTHSQFGLFRNTNKLIPLTVWGKILKKYNKELIDIVNAYVSNVDTVPYTFLTSLSETLNQIESVGMKVQNFEKFDHKVSRHFKRSMAYSQYNIFTTTGRPSNRFGGINFSALNKSDGTREAFISRYDGGILVQMDFEAYHLRLIADEHNIQLPTGSLHTELAKKYFQTDEITDELYAASKQKTFEIMYGMSDETYGIELFDSIVNIRRSFRDVTGSLVLPSGIITEFREPNASKMFNYHVQSLEMVKTLPKLQKILSILQQTTNHLILYTYDSILLDMKSFDKELIMEIVDILEENKKFPVRVYAGENYNDLTTINL